DEDAMVGVGEIVGRSTARSMAKQEDLVGFAGDGTETYFGMTGIVGALRNVDATIGNIAGLKVGTGNAYSELTLGDFRGVVELLPEDVDEDAAWFMSKKFYYSVVYPLAEAAGIANLFDILSDRKGRYLYGYPVVFTSAMPSTEANSQICALLGDLRVAAYLAERKAFTIEASRDVYFGNYQTGIRAVERIDVNVFNVGDTTNPGAVVGLITAAS
ncbi:MAG TPA: phage major capsid protein, partial [Phycisphaerales bacterium]|nr:phage major capsid protein [Phycisphaerales bacterium]